MGTARGAAKARRRSWDWGMAPGDALCAAGAGTLAPSGAGITPEPGKAKLAQVRKGKPQQSTAGELRKLCHGREQSRDVAPAGTQGLRWS